MSDEEKPTTVKGAGLALEEKILEDALIGAAPTSTSSSPRMTYCA